MGNLSTDNIRLRQRKELCGIVGSFDTDNFSLRFGNVLSEVFVCMDFCKLKGPLCIFMIILKQIDELTLHLVCYTLAVGITV